MPPHILGVWAKSIHLYYKIFIVEMYTLRANTLYITAMICKKNPGHSPCENKIANFVLFGWKLLYCHWFESNNTTKMWKSNNSLFIFYWFYNIKLSFFKDQEKKDGDSRRRTSKETGGSGKEGPKGRDWPNPWIYISGNLNFPAAKLCANQVYIRRFEQPISFDLDLVVNDVIM